MYTLNSHEEYDSMHSVYTQLTWGIWQQVYTQLTWGIWQQVNTQLTWELWQQVYTLLTWVLWQQVYTQLTWRLWQQIYTQLTLRIWQQLYSTHMKNIGKSVAGLIGLLTFLSQISPFTSQAFWDWFMCNGQITELKLRSFIKIQGVPRNIIMFSIHSSTKFYNYL